MILKNIINHFNIINLIVFLIYIYILNIFFLTNNIRIKFFLFIINLLIFISIGLYYNLDGLLMIFFTAELTILLIFVILFSQLYTYHKNRYSKFNNIYVLSIILLNINHYESNIIFYKNFYSFSNIISNDFYHIYNTFFEKNIIMTILILLIITLYSIFFILLYYKLDQAKRTEFLLKKNILLLRKQNLIHQTNYNTNIRLFKKKY